MEKTMSGIGNQRVSELREEFRKIIRILEATPTVDKNFGISTEEFVRRQQTVYAALQARGFEAGFVFSDEHYDGDVPYLGGNTNVSIEQVAGVIGKNGFHIVAGLEGGYIAEQLAPRAKAPVHKVELLQLADEKYPIDAERLEDVHRSRSRHEDRSHRASDSAPGRAGRRRRLPGRPVQS
jgi:hypothetical protein